MNATALSLFEQHGEALTRNTPLYLVPVVWGGKTENFATVDATQEEMNRTLTPVLEELEERFSDAGIDSNGISGMEYLLKSLLLYKMAYMTQYYLNCRLQGDAALRENASRLESLEPVGEA